MRAHGLGRRGFVLIAVLWLLVALSAVGLHAGLEMRTERMAAANMLDEARARQAALAGGEYARSRLTAALLQRADELRAQTAQAGRGGNQRQQQQSRTRSVQQLFRSANPMDDPWRDPAGLVLPEMVFGDARFSLHLRDAASVLNLNAATEEMLRNFFSQGLELDFAQADRLTQAVLDWRDSDELPRVGGAERDQYLRAGAAVLPPNRGFPDVDELRHVIGMTPEIFAAALPYLTLRGSGRVNVNAAPEPVLLALPGMTRAAAQELMRLRDAGTFPTNTQELLRALPAASSRPIQAMQQQFNSRVSFRTDEVEIISDGHVEGSAVEARVRLIVVRSDQGAVLVTRVFN
jgi:type II secretory pathway component PulK